MEQSENLPYKLLIGWIPKVSLKEAKRYAIEVADKHCETLEMVSYGVYPFEGGAAYEVHEGGMHKAYLPKVLKHFQQAREAEVPLATVERVVIPTTGRTIQLELMGEGFIALHLPESSPAEPTSWVEPKGALEPVLPTRRAVLVFGICTFIAGFIALVGGLAVRHRPYIAPTPLIVGYEANSLPEDQWHRLISQSAKIEKLEYTNGKWDIVVTKGDTSENTSVSQ